MKWRFRILERAKGLASRPRVRGSAWILIAFAARMVFQGTLFLLLARTLGADGFGAFAAAAAAAAIAGPYVAWGTGNLLIQEVARRREAFAERWGKALLATFASGVPLYLLVVLVAGLFLRDKISLELIVCVAAADLLFARVLDLVSQAYQSVDQYARVAQMQALPNVSRFVAGMVFVYSGFTETPEMWSRLYLVSTAIATAIGLTVVLAELGRPAFALRGMLSDLRVGAHFSVSLSAQSVYNDIDKTMLARMSSTAAVGTYAAAYRIIDVAFMPVRAMLFSTYSQFFRSGAGGLAATSNYARRLLPTACAYSIAAGAMIVITAPIVPVVLGQEFRETVETLRWLALLPLLKSVHYLAADALTGAGLQPVRSRVQLFIAGTNVALNLYLIPAFSWRGAAWASLFCDFLLAAILWFWVVRLLRSERMLQQGATPSLTLDEA